jgi:DNA-binding NtrC family response regulator
MNRRGLLGGLALSVLAAPAAAFDWLTPRLDSNRFGNQLRHQQRQRDRMLERRRANPRPSGAQPTAAQRRAARARHGAEYKRRIQIEGETGANRWLDAQIMAGR